VTELYAPPRLVAYVPFLFGIADRTRLPGTVLVRLLVDIGASASAARSVLARLRADGGLRSLRHGRRTDYELAGLVDSAFRRARRTGHPELPDHRRDDGRWPGEFHGILFTIAESDRSHRDRLRNAARLAGYAPLRPGLMISPWDGWPALADAVALLPAASTVYPFVLRLAAADARSAAAEAWGLARVAAATEALIVELARAVADDSGELRGPAALARYAELALPAYRFFIGVPALPRELLPPDWPLLRLVETLGRVREQFGTAAESYVGEVLAESDRHS
jgi:phenylacetic acid degradation operon negative regulatory protein